jgi:hypothetical protein
VRAGNGSTLWGLAAGVSSLGAGATVLGPSMTVPPLPLVQPPAVLPAACGTTPVVVSPGASMTLTPGSYASIQVRDGATLTLTPGTYDVCSLQTGRTARVEFQSGAGSVLNVVSMLRLGPGSIFEASTDSTPPSVVVGGRRVVFGPGSRVEAILTALEARLSLQRGMTFGGSFLVDEFNGDHSVTASCSLP